MATNDNNEDFNKNDQDFDFDSIKMNLNKLGYYNFLGVKRNATTEEIKKAYRLKSRLFHSDKTKGDDELMKILNNVKMTLIDPEKELNTIKIMIQKNVNKQNGIKYL